MMNNRGPRYKRSQLERRINRDVIWCVILLLFLCFFCAIGSGIWLGGYNDITDNTNLVPFIPFSDLDFYSPLFQGFIVFWTYIIIYQSVIPLPLYVSVELVKLGQVYFIMQDLELYDEESDKRLECRALNITEDLGQIEYIFSDKTGTLTENKMEFKSCDDSYTGQSDFDSRLSLAGVSRSSSIYENLPLEPALQRELSNMCLRSLESVELTIPPHVKRVQEFFLLMAICNTVVVSHHPHEDLMDESGFLAEPYFNRNADQASEAMDHYNRLQQTSTPVSVSKSSKFGSRLSLSASQSDLAEGEVEFAVLNVLHFDATRKRMSVIVRHPLSNEIILFVKGADTAILSILNKRYKEDHEDKHTVSETEKHLMSYALRGLRTLCMARKVLSEDEYQAWLVGQKEAESAMEDRDRKIMDSACRIENDLDLLGATGIEDKLQDGVPETIAKLREAGINVWVLTGDKQETAIQIAYASKLISKDQIVITINAHNKGNVVKLVRDHLEKMTLAIGDGANDVSMIQTADIGVGISGQEGMQAVMASDFAIARFRFLERLLLVHGHWCYDRLAKFAGIMFYKSLISVWVLFWFQIFSGFSGSLMIDSLYLTLQHVAFTALPPLINGVFDKDLSAETLLANPVLYKPCQRSEAYENSAVGIWEFGTTICVCEILSILLMFGIETTSWVWLQWLVLVLSFIIFWMFCVILNAIFFTFDHPSNPYWVMENTISTPIHSCIVIITCVVALMPSLELHVV
nr:hypothetical protein BaRGS_016792 [Batillaria attramentaria]